MEHYFRTTFKLKKQPTINIRRKLIKKDLSLHSAITKTTRQYKGVNVVGEINDCRASFCFCTYNEIVIAETTPNNIIAAKAKDPIISQIARKIVATAAAKKDVVT